MKKKYYRWEEVEKAASKIVLQMYSYVTIRKAKIVKLTAG